MQERDSPPPPARSRTGWLLFALATACGLWFGLSAPDVSPVTPGVLPLLTGASVPVSAAAP